VGPLWSAAFDGVPYVWVCPAYPQSAESFSIDRPLEVSLGDHIELLGYTLSSDTLSAGDALTATLFWQSDGRLTEEYHVFVHLQSADGAMAAQHDGVPVGGKRPTWSWQEGEVFQDVHTLPLLVDLAAGAYTLSVGMYGYPDGARLPALGPDAERLSEDRIVLQEIRVAVP
jgi:hypothetical protein